LKERRISTMRPRLFAVATVTPPLNYYRPSLRDIRGFETSNDELETKKKNGSAY
jgi:hypothetical protein